MFNNKTLVIFDWDGTLMDSVPRIVNAMQSASAFCKLPVPAENDVKSIIGLSLIEGCEILFPALTADQLENLKQAYRKYYVKSDVKTPLFDGARELLEKLSNQQIVMAIATGKGRLGLEQALSQSGCGDFFCTTRTADDCPSKPSPEMLLEIITELNVLPENVIYIGDSIHDIAMANNANIDSVGITLGVSSEQELQSYQPVIVVHNLKALSELF